MVNSKIYKIIFIISFAFFSNVYAKDTISNSIKEIYVDGSLGGENLYWVLGFKDAKELFYDQLKIDTKYENILPDEGDFKRGLPTKQELQLIIPTLEELKTILPTGTNRKNILPSKSDWQNMIPNEATRNRLRLSFYDDENGNDILGNTKRVYNSSIDISKLLYNEWVKPSVSELAIPAITKLSPEIIKAPGRSIKKFPGAYSRGYERAQNAYYGSGNAVTGVFKWSGHMFWANIEGAYYLFIEAPVKTVGYTGATAVGAVAPIVATPSAAAVSLTSFALVPVTFTANSVYVGAAHIWHYGVYPVGKFSIEVVKTTGKFGWETVKTTGKLSYHLAKPIVVTTYVIAKPVVNTAYEIGEMAVDTLITTLYATSNGVYYGGTMLYAGVTTTLTTIGAGVISAPIALYRGGKWLVTAPFNMKYKDKIKVNTEVAYKELENFSGEYAKKKEKAIFLDKFNVEVTRVQEDLSKFKSKISYYTTDRNGKEYKFLNLNFVIRNQKVVIKAYIARKYIKEMKKKGEIYDRKIIEEAFKEAFGEVK